MHFVGGEKGGVGKSLMAKLLAQLFIDRAIEWEGFDTDATHDSFLRAYDGYVQRLDPRRITDLDRVVESLETGAAEVVVDLAGQTEAPLARWIEMGRVFEFLDQLGHALWFWFLIDPGRDSARLLESFVEDMDFEGRAVCVINRGLGRDFSLFEESKLRNRIEQRGGACIELPELDPESMLAIDAHDKSFWAAIHHSDPSTGPCLTRMQRRRVEIFVRTVHERISALL